MRKILFATIIATAALTPAPASAQLGFTVGGGPTLNAGTDGVGSGFNGLVGAEIGLPLLPLSFRVDGMLTRLDLDGVEGDFDVLSGTANAILRLGPGGITPYVIGGVGMYRTKVSPEGGAEAEETEFGVNGGAGLRLGLGRLGVFGEARLHATTNGDVMFAPVTIGVRF